MYCHCIFSLCVEAGAKMKDAKHKEQKNNTRDSNVVPHRSTNLARQCLTSLSRREAVLCAVTVVWSFLSQRDNTNTIMCKLHNYNTQYSSKPSIEVEKYSFFIVHGNLLCFIVCHNRYDMKGKHIFIFHTHLDD